MSAMVKSTLPIAPWFTFMIGEIGENDILPEGESILPEGRRAARADATGAIFLTHHSREARFLEWSPPVPTASTFVSRGGERSGGMRDAPSTREVSGGER
jgi:hypothetical protein